MLGCASRRSSRPTSTGSRSGRSSRSPARGSLIVLVEGAPARARRAAMPVCHRARVRRASSRPASCEFRLWNVVRDDGPITTVAGMVRVDLFGVFLGVVVVIRDGPRGAAVDRATSAARGSRLPSTSGSCSSPASGMLAMTTANDLIVVFVALELLSIPLYVLAAFDRRRLSSQEAGIKYFVLGAFSSAVFLYGVALTYGATGTTSLTGIGDFLAQNTLLEQGTLLAGRGAAARRARLQGRGGAVPHVDARRVPGRADAGHRVHGRGHQGRGVRRAAARLRRGVPALPHRLAPAIVTVLAVLSLVVGSVAAVVQTDVKRMLAYSSIAHAGLHPDGRSPPTRRAAAKPRSSTCSCTRSCRSARSR